MTCAYLLALFLSSVAQAACRRPRAGAAEVQPSRPGRGPRRRAVGLAGAGDADGDGDLRPRRVVPGQAVQRRLVLRERDRRTRQEQAARVQAGPADSAAGCTTSRSATWTGELRVLTPGTEYPDFPRTGLESGRQATAPRRTSTPQQGPGRRCGTSRRTTTATAAPTSSSGSRTGATTAGTTPTTPTASGPAGRCTASCTCSATRGTTARPAYAEPVKVVRPGRQAGRHVRLPVAELRGLRRRRRSRSALRRVPRRLHLLREHRHAHRAALRRRPAGCKTPDGKPLAMDLQMIVPVAFDWDKDGDLDLIVGDEDGRVAFVENTGKLARRPHAGLLPPVYFQQEADDAEVRRAGDAGRRRLGRRRRHRHRQRQHGGLHRVLREPERPEASTSRSGPPRKRLEVGRQAVPHHGRAERQHPGTGRGEVGLHDASASPTGTATACPTSCSTRILGERGLAQERRHRARRRSWPPPQPIEVEWRARSRALAWGWLRARRARNC